MNSKFILFLVFVFVSISVLKSQSMETLQKQSEQTLAKEKNQDLKSFILVFTNELCNFKFESIRKFIDDDHYNFQSKLYFTDDFMFKFLGEVGKRDTQVVHNFYFRELLGLTQVEEEKRIKDTNFKNLFELKEISKIQRVFYTDIERPKTPPSADEIVYIDIYFIAVLKDGQKYIGHYVIKTNPLKVTGSFG